MAHVTAEGAHLSWDPHSNGARLQIGKAQIAGADNQPALSTFDFLVQDGRLTLSVAMVPTTRVIDVSRQPAILNELLARESEASTPGSSSSVIARWVSALAERCSIWHPQDPDAAGLTRTVGGAVFPLLGAAYDQGAAPVDHVPRWAVPVLTQPSARHGAAAAFGPKATRPVIRSLARSLGRPDTTQSPGAGVGTASDVPCPTDPGGHHVDLLRIGLALMGSPVLEPDRITRVLEHGNTRHHPSTWPTNEATSTFQSLAPRLGPERTERLLCEAAERNDGPELLFQLTSTMDLVVNLLPSRLARRLDDLHRQCTELQPVDPASVRGTWGDRSTMALGSSGHRSIGASTAVESGTGRIANANGGIGPPGTGRSGRATNRTRPDPRRAAYVAPRRNRGPADGAPLDLLMAVAALDGVELSNGLRLHTPRSGAVLPYWGSLMGNCLAGFAKAFDAKQSLLIGIEVYESLEYCMEVTPDRTIRQFQRRRHRVVPVQHASAVCEYLMKRGVLDPTRAANRAWLSVEHQQ